MWNTILQQENVKGIAGTSVSDPGFEIFNPGSRVKKFRIRIKDFKYCIFDPQIVSKLLEISGMDEHPGSRILILLPIPGVGPVEQEIL